jgi:GPR1/FUN34/yaaH family
MSYATILIPGSGIVAAFGTNVTQLNNALGIYLLTWTMVTFFMGWVFIYLRVLPVLLITLEMYSVATLRKNVAFVALFVFLGITFALLAGGSFNANTKWVLLWFFSPFRELMFFFRQGDQGRRCIWCYHRIHCVLHRSQRVASCRAAPGLQDAVGHHQERLGERSFSFRTRFSLAHTLLICYVQVFHSLTFLTLEKWITRCAACVTAAWRTCRSFYACMR